MHCTLSGWSCAPHPLPPALRMGSAPKQKNSRSKERCSGNLRMVAPGTATPTGAERLARAATPYEDCDTPHPIPPPGTEASHAGNGDARGGGNTPHRAPPRRRKRKRPTPPPETKTPHRIIAVRRGVADGAESVVRLTVRATSSRRASVPSSRRAAPDPSA